MSPYHFHRIFKATLGVTPKAYAVANRNKRVRDALTRSASVTEAIYDAGFNSNGRFYATSGEVLGMTPSEFRSGAPNAEIKFAIGDSSLGLVLVAASDKGVCAIFFGDDPDGLASDLSKWFPRAQLVSGDRAFEQLTARVISLRRGSDHRARPSLGHSRNRVSTPRLGGVAAHPGGLDGELCGHCQGDWRSEIDARRCTSLRI